MWGFVSALIPWNALSNLELRRWYKVWRDDQVLPSATTFSNICRREYALTVDVIEKQLPSRNEVSLALDGWSPTNTLAITSVIAHHMDRNWELRGVRLVFDEVDRLFISRFKIELSMIGQHPTYWSNASRTFEGLSWLFWAYRRPFAWNYDR